MRITIILMAVLSSALLAACSGGSSLVDLEQSISTTETAGILAGLPGLPTTTPTTKTTLATTYQFTEADLAATGGASVSGSTITLDSSGVSYAVLGVEVTGDDVPAVLHLTGTITSQLWLGLGDYESDCWDWQGCLTAPGDLTVESGGAINGSGWFYVLLACDDGHGAAVQLSMDTAVESWNVMVWIAGDNNLAAMAVDDINEMESVGSSDTMNILVGYDINPFYAPGVSGINQVNFIRVVADSNPNSINVSGDAANRSFSRTGYNSADPDNLADFVDWCESNFTATHSALVIWDHGDGWIYTAGSGSGSGRSASGILCDDTDGDWDLTNNDDVAAALAGYHFDYLCFDACNMGHLEALYEFSGLADYLVASSMLEPGGGFPYDRWLGDWQDGYPLSRAGVGSLLCSRYTAYYDDISDDGNMGCYVAAEVGNLVTALADLADAVTPKGSAEGNYVLYSLQAAYTPEYSDGCADLVDFLTGYREQTDDTAVQALLDDALDIHDAMTVSFTTTQNVSGNGCAVFLPDDENYTEYAGLYRGTAFNQATAWLEMLEAAGLGGGGTELPETSWYGGWRIVCEWDDATPDIQLIIDDPDGNSGHPGDPAGPAANITFSSDNLASGTATEWAELNTGARVGSYLVALGYDDAGPAGADTIDVSIHLEDDSGTLAYDFGTVTIDRGTADEWVCHLTFPGEVAGTWEPGDYVEITWDSASADLDLIVTDPNEATGAPYWPMPLFGRVEFSQDSYESDNPVEWGKLKTGGSTGTYIIQIVYADYSGTPPAEIPVAIRLYDSSDALRQDLGTWTFDGANDEGGYSDPVLLEY